MDLVAAAPGEFQHKAVAAGSRGLKSEAEAVTRVEGLSALQMELADLANPVEVGAETAYEIRVTNAGSKIETNVQLSCTLPDKLEFRSAVVRPIAGSTWKGRKSYLTHCPSSLRVPMPSTELTSVARLRAISASVPP